MTPALVAQVRRFLIITEVARAVRAADREFLADFGWLWLSAASAIRSLDRACSSSMDTAVHSAREIAAACAAARLSAGQA